LLICFFIPFGLCAVQLTKEIYQLYHKGRFNQSLHEAKEREDADGLIVAEAAGAVGGGQGSSVADENVDGFNEMLPVF